MSVASTSVALAPGQSVGKYEVVKHLATGGMAEIYLARVSTLPGLEKLIVLKRILPELAVRDDFVQMFIDEARIATLLDHPNVVQTFDAGVVDGKPYLAMEYLHGEPVSALMTALTARGERLPLEHALAIVIGVCAGLHYAHEKVGLDGRALNIVHRDVTPQNVIVTYDGGVKLVDFGIARSAQRPGRTRYGTIKGKVPYMSPEQCQGEPLDRRSDVFSVGIMLWELTLGRRLFRGKSDYEVLKQIVEGRVTPPRELEPDIDPALDGIVMRALEKDRARRPQTARELQGEIEALARAARLPTSSLALQQLMERCFGSKIQVLREAEAQGNVELLSLILDAGPASAELDELPPSATGTALASPAKATPAVATAEEEAPTLPASPTVMRANEAAAVVMPRRARWPVFVLAAVLGAGGGAALVASNALLRTTTPPPPPAPMTETATTATAAAPAVQRPVEPPPPSSPGPTPALRPASAPRTHRPASPPSKSEHAPPRARPRDDDGGTGMLVLATSPWCRVAIDGVDHGPTPLRITLPAGAHKIDLTNAEFHIARQLTIHIRMGETVRKSFDFGE